VANVLVVAEHSAERVKDTSFELISLGRELAAGLGGELQVALLGHGTAAAAAALARRGGIVHHADHPSLSVYTSDAYAPVVAAIARSCGASLVLLAHSPLGWDLAPRLAVDLDAGLVTECINASASAAGVVFIRRVFNGKLDADVRLKTAVQIATIRAGVRPPAEGDGDGEVRGCEVALDPSALRIAFIETRRPPKGKVDLTQCDVVVSGGRGLGGADKFKILEELAEALGGEVGASRPVVDAGWLPHERQVGSSGVTVAPKLYIACGISGAMHHLVGMKGSKFVIAINKDADAPIFEVADLGVVGDLFEVVPALTQAVKAARA
jgi:electron transfer flavoprotein alpha subunit